MTLRVASPPSSSARASSGARVRLCCFAHASDPKPLRHMQQHRGVDMRGSQTGLLPVMLPRACVAMNGFHDEEGSRQVVRLRRGLLTCRRLIHPADADQRHVDRVLAGVPPAVPDEPREHRQRVRGHPARSPEGARRADLLPAGQ